MKRMKKFLAVLLAAVMVMAMGSVSAFAAGTVTLTVTGSTGGTVSATYGSSATEINSGTTEVGENETVTLTVTPNSGYVLSSLTVTDGSSNTVTVSGSGLTYTFSMPDSNATVTATFAEATYKITVTNSSASDGETYSAYKIFDVTYSGSAYSYTISSDNVFFSVISGFSNLDGDDTDTDYFKLTAVAGTSSPVVYVVEMTSNLSNLTELPSEVVEALAEANLSSAIADGTATLSNGTAVIGLAEAGYYFVNTSTGSAVMIYTTDPTATVTDKNTAPSVDKNVSDTEGGSYASSSTAGIGDPVYFKAVVSKINKASNIVFHDTMSSGLSYGSVTSVVYHYSTTDTTGTILIPSTNYTVVSPGTETSDPCTFEIDFSSYLSGLTNLTDTSYIEIYYTATVNSNAMIGSTGNTNTAQVSYGDTSTSEVSTTTTYVYEVNIFKYTGTDTPLEGVKFVLYKGSDPKYYAQVTSGKLTGWTQDSTDSSVTLTTDSYGMIYIDGLDAGTYYLMETETLSGYNALTSIITVHIAENGTVTFDYGTNTDQTTDNMTVGGASVSNVIKVENSSGTVIPTTGGMGTTILYIIGAILVIGAAVILITRRRMANR